MKVSVPAVPTVPGLIVPPVKLRLPLTDPLPIKVCEDPSDGLEAPLISSTAPAATLMSGDLTIDPLPDKASVPPVM